MGNKIDERAPTKGAPGTKSFTWDIYIVAMIATVIVFTLGILVGKMMTNEEIEGLKRDIEEMSVDSSLIQIMIMSTGNGFKENMSTYNKQEACEIYSSIAYKLDESLRNIGRRLERMESKGVFDASLKSIYMTLEYRNYLLVRLGSNVCKKTKAKTILYIYKNPPSTCPECTKQENAIYKAIEELENKGTKVFVYAFDRNINNTVMSILTQTYNIDIAPTTVIDSKVYRGYTNSSTIVNTIINTT